MPSCRRFITFLLAVLLNAPLESPLAYALLSGEGSPPQQTQASSHDHATRSGSVRSGRPTAAAALCELWDDADPSAGEEGDSDLAAYPTIVWIPAAGPCGASTSHVERSPLGDGAPFPTSGFMPCGHLRC